MRGVSQVSFAEGQERLETLLASVGPPGGGPAGAGPAGARPPGVGPAGARHAAELGEALFAVTDVLAANPGLRRALTDPARDGQSKAALVDRLFGGRLPSDAVDVLAGAVRSRWSSAGDLVDALESYAVSSVLAAADAAGHLDGVEDELFRFARTVEGDLGLRDAFSYRTQGADRKAALVRQLLEGRAAPETVRLAVQAAAYPRGLRTEQVLERFVQAAADRRRQVIAHVIAATPLTAEQRRRLETALRRRYGRVRLNVDLDPAVLGGLRVEIGSELVDGTVSARLEEARRRLAG